MAVPAPDLLQLGRQRQQQRLACGRADELGADRQTAGGEAGGTGRIRNSGSLKEYGPGQAGAEGLVVPPDPSAGTMLAGKVFPEVVSLVFSTL